MREHKKYVVVTGLCSVITFLAWCNINSYLNVLLLIASILCYIIMWFHIFVLLQNRREWDEPLTVMTGVSQEDINDVLRKKIDDLNHMIDRTQRAINMSLEDVRRPS